MSTRIEFINTSGNIITPQQLSVTRDYYKLNFIDHILKTKYFYINNQIIDAFYYLSIGENIIEVGTNLDQSHNWSIINDYQTINNYSIWKQNYLKNNHLSDVYAKKVYDANNNEIASIGYDSCGNPTRGGAKTFYLGGHNIMEDGYVEGVFEDDAYIVFYFDINGNIEIHTNTELFFKPYNNLSRFLKAQQGGAILGLMTPEMITYYTNLLPLVPNF